jgi:hypothetical protein
VALIVISNTNATGTVMKIADQLTYFLLLPTEKEAFARQIFTGLRTGHPDSALFART